MLTVGFVLDFVGGGFLFYRVFVEVDFAFFDSHFDVEELGDDPPPEPSLRVDLVDVLEVPVNLVFDQLLDRRKVWDLREDN